MTFDEVIRDRDFAALPMEERRKVLSHVDTDFAGLDVNEQNKVLYRLAPTTASQGNPNPRNESISAERPYDPEWAKDYHNLYGLYGAAKELYKTIGRPVISGIGMGVGAAWGAASPVPGGAMIGGGLGYAAGENINAALDELFELRRPGTPLARRAVETLKNIETGAVLEGGGNLLSRGAGWTLGKLLAPYSKEYTPQSADIASKAKELGITLSPAEVTGSKNLALVESLLEKSPTSADVPLGWRQANQLDPLKVLREKALEGSQSATELAVGSDIKARVDAYLSRFKGVKQEYLDAMRKRLYASALGSNKTASELGESAKELLSNRSAAAVAKRRAVYDEVGANVPDEKVRASELQKVADELAKEVSKLPSQNQTLKSVLAWARETKVDTKVEQIVRQMEADNYTPELQKKILEQMGFDAGKLTREPVQRNWKTLQDFRTQLNDLIRQEDMSIKSGNPSLRGQVTNEGRIYTRLKEALDKDFEKIAESSGSEALDALKAANAFYKDEYAPIWRQKITRKLGYENPEKVVDVIFRPNMSTEIGITKKALGKAGFDETLKKAFTGRLLGQGKTESFDPKYLEGQLSKIGDDTLKSIYAPAEIETLRKTAKLGRLQMERSVMGENFLRGIADTDPKFIVDSILGTPDKFAGSTVIARNVSSIKRVMDDKSFANLKQLFTERLFKESFLTGNIQPETLSKTIQKYGKVLNEFYKPEELSWLNNIAAVTKRMASAERSAANPSGTAQNIIAYGTFGMILRNPIKGTAYAIAPNAFARFYLSPMGRRYFTEGLKTPVLAKEAPALFERIAGLGGIEVAEQSEMSGDNQ